MTAGKRKISLSQGQAHLLDVNEEGSALKPHIQKQQKQTQQVIFMYLCIHTYVLNNDNQRKTTIRLRMGDTWRG